MKEEKFRTFLEVGVSLSAERNYNRLLEKILLCVMELSNCDAGTLYLLEGGALHFKIMRNNTMNTYSGGDGSECGLPPVALNRESVCALALLDDETIRIEDFWNCQKYDLAGPMRYDAMTGYHTQSMIVVPMRNREGGKVGVLQLINAQDDNGAVCPFEDEIVLAVESVASQAAITVQNVRYIAEIKNLFHSVVKVMSSAVDERTPYNGSHTRHMAQYGSQFLDFLNERRRRTRDGLFFTPAHKEEIIMSIWFHDIGKLVTPLEVMNIMARLSPEQYTAIAHRMEVIRLRGRDRPAFRGNKSPGFGGHTPGDPAGPGIGGRGEYGGLCHRRAPGGAGPAAGKDLPGRERRDPPLAGAGGVRHAVYPQGHPFQRGAGDYGGACGHYK